MKNVIRVFGIIAMIAVIGLVSCGVDPDDQTYIKIDLPEGYDEAFAAVIIYDDIKGTNTLAISRAKEISGNSVSLALFKDNGDAIVVDKGVVGLVICTDSSMDKDKGEILYAGATEAVLNLGKGEQTIPIEKFIPAIKAIKKQAPAATNYGSYKTTYTLNNVSVTEIIELSQTEFKISDDSQSSGTADHLYFKITGWETANVPEDYPSYTGAYKFTGKITSNQGYISATSKTAPGFAATDANDKESGPECWMYIYFKGTTGDITFIRTAFSKAAKINNGVVTGSDNKARVYTKFVPDEDD